MYLRKAFASLEDHLDNKLITVITGLRRVGKSTALKHLFKVFNLILKFKVKHLIKITHIASILEAS